MKWNEAVGFGKGQWVRFEVSVWDRKTSGDNSLSRTDRYVLPDREAVSETRVKFRSNGGQGRVWFSYSYMLIERENVRTLSIGRGSEPFFRCMYVRSSMFW